MKVGDLIRTMYGRFGTIVNGPYTYRFMEAEDWEMVQHGMGELAGLYGSAVDVRFTDNGRKERLRVGRGFEVLAHD